MCNAHGDGGSSYGCPQGYGTTQSFSTPGNSRIAIMTQPIMQFKSYSSILGGYKNEYNSN